jgi:hypothetical protein
MFQESPVRVEFVRVPAPSTFPEFQEKLIDIGGKTPDGRPRLKLEWGGEETRFFAGQRVAKYRFGLEQAQVGWSVPGNPRAKKKSHREPVIHIDTLNPEDWPAEYQPYRKGIMAPRYALLDIPICNWFVCEWISPQKCAVGWEEARWYNHDGMVVDSLGSLPRNGYYYPLLQIQDAEAPGLYAEPNEEALALAQKYFKQFESIAREFDVHIDEPMPINHIVIQQDALHAAIEEQKAIESAKFRDEAFHLLEHDVAALTRAYSLPSVK